MLFIKAKTTDDTTELFALDKILNITPRGETTKILMGAGLFWRVYSDSIEILDLSYNDLQELLKGDK